MIYDVIGDLHGHASELVLLLEKLGYKQENGVFQHPEGRKVLFLGDYIDRGPEIVETLRIVRSMTENGHAIALMGNHEYNAVLYNTSDGNGGHLRENNGNNETQHQATLKQFKEDMDSYYGYIEWFKTLPLFFENEHFRAVHACWDEENIANLRKLLINDRLSEEQFHQSADKNNPLFQLVEETLKGKEIPLPNKETFIDEDGHSRSETRVKWWENPVNSTYLRISMVELNNSSAHTIIPEKYQLYTPYPETAKPVFFGHYWMEGEPKCFRPNVCCLDWSVAKGGSLVGCRVEEAGNKLIVVQSEN